LLISKKEIIKYLQNIPPVPENVKKTLEFLKNGDVKNAAIEAQNDLILKKRIENVVNSAYYALPNKIDNIVQLFTMLGIEKSKSLIFSYLVSLLEPKKWEIFNINFFDFQALFMHKFEEYMKIEFDEKTYKHYADMAAIIPASICICDSLLGNKKENVELLISNAPLEYGTIIKRMSGIGLFSIAAKIGEIWSIETDKTNILKNAECNKCNDKISALIHLVFFSIVSKKQFLDLNSLIEFNPECINLIPKTYERIVNDS